MSKSMKRWTVFSIIWLILIGGGLGCRTDLPSPDVSDLGPNLLIETRGAVSLKRDGWSDYVPVTFGTEVRRGDLIRPDDGQTITILCADLTLQTVEREGPIPCKVKVPVLQYGESSLLAPRPENNALIPYILHPRNTKVLNANPLLKWYDTGASSYMVTVFEDGKEHWKNEDVQATEMRYPNDALPLLPGKHYLLEVTDKDSGHNSSEDSAQVLTFQVLNSKNPADIEAPRDQILALEMDESAEKLALAVYYEGLEVRGEALALLEEIDPSFQTPAIQLRRGDLLMVIELLEDAAIAYKAALKSANNLGDKESQAAAKAGLWRATKDNASLDEAIEIYEALGDKNAVERLLEEANPSE